MIPLILSIFLLGNLDPGNMIRVSDADDKILIGTQMQYLEDSNKDLKIEDVLSMKFSCHDRPFVGFGYGTSVYWIKWTILNNGTEKKLLHIPQVNIDSISLYQVEGGKITRSVENVGDRSPYHNREIKSRDFVFPIEKSRHPVTCILRLQTTSHLTFVPKLWSVPAFYRDESLKMGFVFGYIILMVIMVLFNLFFYITIRDREHLIYILLTISYIINIITARGLGFQFLWPESPEWNNLSSSLSIAITGFLFMLLTKFYFNLRRKAFLLDVMVNISLVLMVLDLAALAFFKNPLFQRPGWYFFLFLLGLLTVYSLVLAIKGSRTALYYFLSWIGYFIFFVVGLFYYLNIFYIPVVSGWVVELGSVFQVLFISFGISEKFQLLQHEIFILKNQSHKDGPSRQDQSVTASIEGKLKRAAAYLDNNYHLAISREEIAIQIGLNTDYFGRAFKLYTGKTFNEYVNTLRIEDAASRLSDTDETIVSIAFSVGFESLRTFNRVFHKYMKETPSQYRERTQN